MSVNPASSRARGRRRRAPGGMEDGRPGFRGVVIGDLTEGSSFTLRIARRIASTIVSTTAPSTTMMAGSSVATRRRTATRTSRS